MLYALFAFLRRWASIKKTRIKMIFPSEIRNYCNRTQPAKGHEAMKERAQIKMCKFARSVRAKKKTRKKGHKTRNWVYSDFFVGRGVIFLGLQ